MTCREKLAIDCPEYVNDSWDGGCKGCPGSYGYLPRPIWCEEDCDSSAARYNKCAKCWDREIPEEKYEPPHVTFDDIVNNAKRNEILKEQDLANRGGIIFERGQSKKDPEERNVIQKAWDAVNQPAILDSGNRREFDTGAVRDIQEGKGRCDLMPLDVVSMYFNQFVSEGCKQSWIFYYLDEFTRTGEIKPLIKLFKYVDFFDTHYTTFLEVSKHFEEGAKKYGENNWQKGIPVRCYIDSAVRHYLKYLRGDKDEPHDRAFCWNILCCIWTCKHMPELNDYRKDGTDDEKSETTN